MKAVYSSSNESLYSFFIPIAAWCWSKIQVDSIVFIPKANSILLDYSKAFAATLTPTIIYKEIDSPAHKIPTFLQCSRLYAAALDLPENELLFTSDVDMAVFKLPPFNADIYIHGADLVPENQFPICYAAARVGTWRMLMEINGRGYQECLDDLLGHIECDHMRGNYWGKDQETLYNKTHTHAHKIPRARPGTQFATNRVDRDDINWRSYCGPDLIDAHLWRPGYQENNFNNIMELLKIQYPQDNFQWLIDYKNDYISLL
jgi:hypothetical protein